MKVRLDETLFKARAQENLAMTNEIDKLEQVDALVECLDHFVADRKWVDEVTRDELLTMVTQSHGDKGALVESVLAKFNTPCIDAKKLKECRERRQNKGLKESMKKRKSIKESDNRDTFTLDTSNTPILDCGLYYTLLGELDPGRYDERFKEFEDCVKECAQPILDELVRKTPNFEVVSVGTYYHPRYYNYETDSLEFTVKYTGDELGTVIEEYSNNQDFIDFLQNYKSYDGFISFYADNKDEFITQDYIKSVSQIIKYNVTQEEYERANEELYYDVEDCGFYPDDYEDEMEEGLKEKKYDIYVNGKYVASSDRHKRAKDIEDNIRKDGKIKYAGEKAIKTAGVELDELNVDAKDKLKVKRARESKKLKEGYTPAPMSATDFFDSFDFTIYKSTDEDGDPCYKLRDNQGANLGDIEDDTFSSISDAVDRLDIYYEDYIINDLSEIAPELSGLHSGNYEDVFNKIKDMDKTADGHSLRGHKALLYYILHPEQLKDDVRELTESKQLKEGYYGQTLQDFLDDCMDYSVIDKVYIYGDDDVVYEGPIYDIPEDMLETEFLECDMYTNKKSVVTVNVDTSEEYGAGIYEFLSEFLDDCNCDEVVIYDLSEGEEIFNGYKEDIPEEYLEYAFASYDAPEELSVNLSDYEGEDDFDESLKEDNKVLDKGKMITNSKGVSYYQKGNKYYSNTGWSEKEITKDEFDKNVEQAFKEVDESLDRYSKETKDFANKLCRLAKKDNRKLKFEDACEVIDQSFNNNVDNIEDFYKRLNFDDSLKESDDSEVEKLDTFDDQMDFLAKDEQEAIDGYKKVINKVRNTKVKAQLKKIETEEKAHKDYLNKVKKNKDLEYTEPLIERKGNKCCKGKCKKANESLEQYHYARVLKKLAGRTITEHDLDDCAKELGMDGYRLWNVLKALVDDMYITNGEKYGEEYFKIPSNAYDELPSELKENLKEADNLQTRATKMLSVQKYQIDLAWKNGKTWKTDPMTLDEISKSVGARVTEKQFVDMMSDNIKGRKDAKNLTKAEIVKLYDYIDGKWKGKDVLWSIKGKTNENLKESTIPVKDLLIKTDNKYGITLDHAIDDIKRERGYNAPLLGDNRVINQLMRRYDLEFRDVIRVLNYKFDGLMLDEGCGRKKTSKRAK